MEEDLVQWQWFETNQKPKHGQQVIVLMISPTGGDDPLKVKHSLYLDILDLKGFGDAWNEVGFIDEDLILLWTPYYPPTPARITEVLNKFDNKEQPNG